jgi:hypothetical protein
VYLFIYETVFSSSLSLYGLRNILPCLQHRSKYLVAVRYAIRQKIDVLNILLAFNLTERAANQGSAVPNCKIIVMYKGKEC